MSRTVRQYMTASPRRVAPGELLEAAHRLMRSEGIRHLPVVEGERVVGILSQRDVFLMETLKSASPEEARVEEAMRARPFVVPPDASLARVVRAMSDARLGAALVVEGERLVGIFTRSDALRALTALLEDEAGAAAPLLP